MEYIIDNGTYKINVNRKHNKNTYIRIKNDLSIEVSTGYFTSTKAIISLLDKNKEALKKMIIREQNEQIKKQKFFYLGLECDIIIIPTIEDTIIDNNKIIVKDMLALDKWYKKEIKRIFSERLNYNYHLFKETIPYPKLKIRLMKTRWGVCNRKDNSVTLNSKLFNYSINEIDYVIIHELSHFIHFNHSRNFWNTVSTYFPNYKKTRNNLKK